MNVVGQETVRPKYWKGFLYGFLFGTLGVWLLAALSLISRVFETLSAAFLVPGRLFASVLVPGDGSDLAVIGLFTLTGVFYGLIGMLIQYAARTWKARAKTV